MARTVTTEEQDQAFTLTILVMGVAAAIALVCMPDQAPVRQAVGTQPRPAAWEVRSWADSRCDRCGKGLTADPQDGTYIIGGKPFWLHKGCVAPVVKAARR